MIWQNKLLFIIKLLLFIFNQSNAQFNKKQITDLKRTEDNTVRYYGWQLWKIHETNLTNTALKEFWRNFGKEVWNINEDGIDILIDYKNTAKAKMFIKQTKLTYNVMISDIEMAIEETYNKVNNLHFSLPWLRKENTTMSWNEYHDISDIQEFLRHVVRNNSDVTKIINIGLTPQKIPMEVLRLSNGGKNNPAVFIDAGLQARDWLSIAAVTYAISKLTWFWQRNEVRHMRHIDWYFLPVANPDGYQYARKTDRLWTKNRSYNNYSSCYGINLDRNFAYQWGNAGSSANSCHNLYRGMAAFTAEETVAMRDFLLNMKDHLDAYISFSAYGQSITYPWGDADYVTLTEPQLHKLARKAMLKFRKLNQAEYQVGTSYRLKLARSGNSADWVQEFVNPPYVYTVFLKDLGRYAYLMPPQYIVEAGEEVYAFIKTIAAELIQPNDADALTSSTDKTSSSN